MRVGLLGGSFDPPHEGHVHISRWAIRTFELDQVWWLVSPGNPLKEHGPAPIEARMEAARAIVRHPRIKVTDLERHLGTRFTHDTLQALVARRPGVRFAWLMGADNLAQFHRWQNWTGIMQTLPVGVLARPGEQVAAGLSNAATMYAGYRLNARRAGALVLRKPPCWTLLTGPMVDMSSSRIRASGNW